MNINKHSMLSNHRTFGGKGLFNKLLDKLPFELHIPTYKYKKEKNKLSVFHPYLIYSWCGPGTRVENRLKIKSEPKNLLDAACKKHDLFYYNNPELSKRNQADKVLASEAYRIFKGRDSSIGEKLAALLVSGTMKAKSKAGFGITMANKKHKNKKHKHRKTKKRIHRTGRGLKKNKGITFNAGVKKARMQIIKEKPKDLNTAITIAKKATKNIKKSSRIPRVIKIPHRGGWLQFLPAIFAGKINN